jgi:hypothetical protein
MANKLKPIVFTAPDITDDINDIKDILESQSGMKVSRPNVVRSCIKAWYELNNNG